MLLSQRYLSLKGYGAHLIILPSDSILNFQVLMKDISTPVPPHEVRAVIKKSLENAALVNYERLSEEARIEGM